MNSLQDTQSREDTRSGDREISLGAGTILSIFFAIALVCAAFFGFGYTLGRKSAQATFQSAAAAQPAAPILPSITVKPAAGSPASKPATTRIADPETPTPPSAQPDTETVPVDVPPTPSSKHTIVPSDTIIAGEKLPAVTPQPLPSIAAGGAFMVQIAAVSSQEIADMELTALKKYNYAVIVRHEPQDALLHVQIGPFATRKEAEAMRQNVISHGFNAIVK